MSKAISFSSVNEAVSQGFVIAARKEYQTYKGCSIYGHDNSARGFAGISFGLRVEIPEDFTTNYLGTRSDKIFGKTVNVSVPSRGSTGSAQLLLMFEPQVFHEALVSARAWTDAWFHAHPEALTLVSRREGRRTLHTATAEPKHYWLKTWKSFSVLNPLRKW